MLIEQSRLESTHISMKEMDSCLSKENECEWNVPALELAFLSSFSSSLFSLSSYFPLEITPTAPTISIKFMFHSFFSVLWQDSSICLTFWLLSFLSKVRWNGDIHVMTRYFCYLQLGLVFLSELVVPRLKASETYYGLIF